VLPTTRACRLFSMGFISPGFVGRRRGSDDRLPPGQYLAHDFPVLSAGPTPKLSTERWEFTVTTETGEVHAWTWAQLLALPAENFTVDIHCVTKWTKLDTGWRGVAIDTLLQGIETSAEFVVAHSYDGYTTNLPLSDLLDGQAWVAYRYDSKPLTPEHGGPARLLVPHLYLWKSAKWIQGLRLLVQDEPGFWENAGYHNYGDPWREQRYAGD
jgi:DMSO/TMAO reductase YedYZ molybdopterin-dependent catalytic subunit